MYSLFSIRAVPIRQKSVPLAPASFHCHEYDYLQCHRSIAMYSSWSSRHRGTMIALVRFAASSWHVNIANMSIPSQLSLMSCTAFLQTLHTVYKSSSKPSVAPGKSLQTVHLIYKSSSKPRAALGEFLQTVQTVYKPSHKPCTPPKEFLQTVQTIS